MPKSSVGHGKDFAVQIDEHDVSQQCVGLTWPITAAVAEAIGAQDTHEEYLAGLMTCKPTVGAMLNDATNAAYEVLDDKLGTKVYLGYAPFGLTAGYPALETYGLLTEQDLPANLTDVVKHNFSVQGDQECDEGIVLYQGTQTASTDSTGVVNAVGGFSRESDDNVDTDVDLTSAGVRDKLAMAFYSPKEQTPCSRIRLWLKKIGAPAGNLTAAIFSDNGAGLPNAALQTSANVAADTLAVGYAWIDFTFVTNPILAPNTKYHVVLESNGGYAYNNGVTEVDWGYDASSPSTTGYASDYQGAAWAATPVNSTRAYELHATNELIAGVLRVTAWTGAVTSLDVKIQDAPDNSTWADLVTFTQNTGVGVERKETAHNPINADLRTSSTIVLGAGTSCTFNVTAAYRTRSQ